MIFSGDFWVFFLESTNKGKKCEKICEKEEILFEISQTARAPIGAPPPRYGRPVRGNSTSVRDPDPMAY